MRRDLIILISETDLLNIYQTETPVKDDVSKFKSITDIKSSFINNQIKYSEVSYLPSATFNGVNYYDNIVGKEGTPDNIKVYERNIYIINKNKSGAKIIFKDKAVNENINGMVAMRRDYDTGCDGDNLEVYCGANQFKHLQLGLRRLTVSGNANTLEYTTVKNILY